MPPRYSRNFERDWSFYVSNRDRLTFCGTAVQLPPGSADGLTAKEYFHRLDSNGHRAVDGKTCCEPELLRDVVRFKKALNFQLKQWAEGFQDMMETVDYYLAGLDAPPEWVRDALEKAVERITR